MALKLRLRGFGAPVKLSQDDVAGDGPVWIQVAKEGKWDGHPSGRRVEFSGKTFDQLIKNFRANPWYHAGPDGVGDQKVIPFDYEHASEMSPTEGSLPVTGAPAPAWALELQARPGEDGVELWALTQLSSQAREQIREGGYLSTSVAVWPDAKDAITNKPIGALLTSIAFTNHPFIKGMAPIAASMSVYGEAETPEEFMVGVRDLLGLEPVTPPQAVGIEIENLRAAVANGISTPSYPDGYGCIVDCIRRLLGMRVLASTDEILDSAGQAIAAAAQPNAPATNLLPEETMNAPAATQPALAALIGKLADLFNCRDSEPMLLAAAEKAKVKGDSLDQLLGLFESDDMTALLGDAAKTIEKAKKADEYLAGLTAARDRLGKTETATAEAETEQIAASMGLSGDNLTRFKPLLLTARLACNPVYDGTCVKPEDFKKADEAAALRLASFRTTYPAAAVDPRASLLTQSLVAGPNGQQLMGGAPTVTQPVLPTNAGAAPQHLQLLAGYPGKNEIEKAMAYHSEKTPGFSLHPRQVQVRAASAYVRTGQLAL